MRVLEELAIGGIEGFIGRLLSPLEGIANALHGYLYGAFASVYERCSIFMVGSKMSSYKLLS
jgi:hypothetical protein